MTDDDGVKEIHNRLFGDFDCEICGEHGQERTFFGVIRAQICRSCERSFMRKMYSHPALVEFFLARSRIVAFENLRPRLFPARQMRRRARDYTVATSRLYSVMLALLIGLRTVPPAATEKEN